jgi:hypothetical protein
MNVWVMQQTLSPGVQHTEEADLRPEMLRVGGDGAQHLRRRSEQNVVNYRLVLKRDDLDLRRHGEHDVEIRHIEQFRLTVLQPLRPRQTLALRAIAVATRVEGDALMAALAALLDVTAERSGATGLDRGHGTPLCRGQRRTVPITKSRTEVAEHVRHFQPLAGHETACSGRHEPRYGGKHARQRIQRTDRGADLVGGDPQIA